LTKILIVVITLLLSFSCLKEDIHQQLDRVWTVQILVNYFHDPGFPRPSKNQLRESLNFAKIVFQKEFKHKNIKFIMNEEIPLREYFNVSIKEHLSEYDELAKNSIFENVKLKPANKDQLKFLRRHKLEILKSFLSHKNKKNVNNYSDFYSLLHAEWIKKLNNLHKVVTLILPNNSYLAWEHLLKYNQKFDLALTNTVIFNDNLSRPSPHSIFKQGKISGFARSSPNAPSGLGMAIVASTSSYMNVPYFSETRVSAEELPYLFGAYTIAHEMGHAIFKLDDYYDHPDHCLMTSSKKLFDVRMSLIEFEKHPQICPICKPVLKRRKKEILNRIIKSSKGG